MANLELNLQRVKSSRWVQLLIILATLAVSAGVAFASSINLSLLVVGIPVLIILYLLFTRYPTLGPAAVLLSGVMSRFEIPLTETSGINITMIFLGIAVGVWLLNMIIVERRIQFNPDRVLVPLLSLIFVATFSLLTGQLDWYPVEGAPMTGQLAGWGMFVLTAAAFILAGNQIKSLQGLKWMVWVFIAFGSLNMLNRTFLQLPFYDIGMFAPNASGSVYWIWLVALPLSQVLFNRELSKIARALLGAVVLLTIYVAVGPGITWASGWVPLVAVFAVLLGLKSPRLLIPVVLIVVLIVVMNYDTLFNEFWLGVSHEHYSANTRIAAWEVVLQIAGKNPVWGLGPSNYYYYTPLYTLLGYRVQFNSHSQYIDLIAQVGVLGLFFFLWFMVAIGRLALQLNRRVRSVFAQAYAYGALAAVVGMLVAGILGDWLIPFLYNITLGGFRSSAVGWTLLGALVAIKWNFPDEIMADSAESQPPKPPN